jgi:hypothetical protein
VGLLPCWDYGFEFRREHGSLSFANIGSYQVEICATVRPIVQRSPTEFGVSECGLETSMMRRPWPARAVHPLGGGGYSTNFFNPLNAKLNPICHLLALLGAHHILHVRRIRVK